MFPSQSLLHRGWGFESCSQGSGFSLECRSLLPKGAQTYRSKYWHYCAIYYFAVQFNYHALRQRFAIHFHQHHQTKASTFEGLHHKAKVYIGAWEITEIRPCLARVSVEMNFGALRTYWIGSSDLCWAARRIGGFYLSHQECVLLDTRGQSCDKWHLGTIHFFLEIHRCKFLSSRPHFFCSAEV